MAATTEVKRLVLRKLASDAVANGATLQATLQAAAFGTVTQTLTGKILVEAQSESIRTRYELPVGAGSLQPQEVAAMLSQLLDLYDASVLALGGTPTDAAITAQMLGQIAVIRSYSIDHTNPQLR